MIAFDPRFTEIVFFDLECYVPPEDRTKQTKGSLIYNAANPTHFILGGVFRRLFPIKGEKEPALHIWNFEKKNEKATLQQIYEYFNASWQKIDARSRKDNPDLMLAGIGISRLDVPALFVRSALHCVDSEEALYETFFKAKIVDLCDVGIPICKRGRQCYPLYPATANDLLYALQLKSMKTSGKRVWDMYDLGDFEGIKARTASEVEDAIAIADRVVRRS